MFGGGRTLTTVKRRDRHRPSCFTNLSYSLCLSSAKEVARDARSIIIVALNAALTQIEESLSHVEAALPGGDSVEPEFGVSGVQIDSVILALKEKGSPLGRYRAGGLVFFTGLLVLAGTEFVDADKGTVLLWEINEFSTRKSTGLE